MRITSAYELAQEGTDLANCELVIDELPVVVRCHACCAEGAPQSINRFCCTQCGSNDVEIIGGRELEVAALEIES